MLDNVVLMKFGATWCGPCKALSAVMEKVEIPFEVQVFDADENQEVFKEFGIRGVPTLVLVKDGEEILRKSGFMSEDQLKQFLGI